MSKFLFPDFTHILISHQYGSMVLLALGGVSFFTVAQSGEDIDFY